MDFCSGSPQVTNLTCPDERSVYLEWSRPEVYFHSVDGYRVYYRRRDASDGGNYVTSGGGSDVTSGGSDVDAAAGTWSVQERLHQKKLNS
jgi:hypothetical protein